MPVAYCAFYRDIYASCSPCSIKIFWIAKSTLLYPVFKSLVNDHLMNWPGAQLSKVQLRFLHKFSPCKGTMGPKIHRPSIFKGTMDPKAHTPSILNVSDLYLDQTLIQIVLSPEGSDEPNGVDLDPCPFCDRANP